jgi:hypothetical protein
MNSIFNYYEQFRLTEKVALKEPLTTEKFMALYEIDCPRAYDRLCRKGVPEPMKSFDNIDHKKVALLVVSLIRNPEEYTANANLAESHN